MKEEVYSYIVSSIYLLNQSIKSQDENTAKLFSYLYGNYSNMNMQLQNTVTNEDLQFLSYCIVNLDTKIKKVLTKTKKIDENIINLHNKVDNIIDLINDIEHKKNIKESKLSKIIKSFRLIKEKIINLYNSLYKRIYNFIFQKRIKRELEEQRQREIELENQRKIEKQRIISNILNQKK